MLTKSDLKAIKEVVESSTFPKFEKLDIRFNKLERKVGAVDKKIDWVKRRFDDLFTFLDKKYLESKRDVRKIQSHLHLPLSDF